MTNQDARTPETGKTPPANGKRATNELPALTDVERASLDIQIREGTEIPAEMLKRVLRAAPPPEPELRLRYAARLLDHALSTRDAVSALVVTHVMDADPAIDETLWSTMSAALSTAPDTVYALIRARMADGQTEKWTERLQVAAVCALQVAITDGDSETAINWLRLVAREPASYGLGAVLHNALMAAAERAHDDGQLGRMVLPLAVRRDHDAVNDLLNDEAFMAALPDNMGRVLRDFEGDALRTLQNHGPEMFLVVLVRAAEAKSGTLFTAAAVEQVWGLYTGAQAANAPPGYEAERIVEQWTEDGATWLSDSALTMLMALSLRDRRDDLFVAVATQLAKRDDLVRRLATAMQRSNRPESDLLVVVAQLQTNSILAASSVVDLYMRLLNAWEWRKSALPVVQQLVRTVQQNPALPVSTEVLWHLLDVAAETKDEAISRLGTRRLTTELETIEDEGQLTEALLRLVNVTQWHPPTRQFVVSWWRGFVRGGALARLQRIDKAMEGKRSLDELRTIIQTVIGFRKLLGKRNLQQFAWDVGVAYGILQAFAESFEPSAKRPLSFDQTTIRAELEARGEELTPHERKIMGNNLKELAQLIGGMGDNRTKATLMRRGEDIERGLMSGEQQPHGAVDVLKWLAGYLGGSQERETEDEE